MALAEDPNAIDYSDALDAAYEDDSCGSRGALRLKQRIEEYWAERGYVVSLKLHHAGFTSAMRSCRTDIRSDMINGKPRFRALPSPEDK